MATVHGTTEDQHGNRKDWAMSAVENFSDDAMVERRLRKRHVAVFDTDPSSVTWQWISTAS